MMFARYKGSRMGMTEGKIYIAKPQMEENSVVGLSRLSVRDDDGKVVSVDPESGQFEFLSEVYAVVVKPFDGFLEGEVVVLDDATMKSHNCDEILYSVKGLGCRNASSVNLLDRSNVYPGVTVMETVTGNWVKVRMVDEALWLRVGDSEVMRSPEEFRFAVADGDLMSEPVVKCLDASGEPNLTVGRYYVVQTTMMASGCIVVRNDRGDIETYLENRFKLGE